jgi:hypothetical protein
LHCFYVTYIYYIPEIGGRRGRDRMGYCGGAIRVIYIIQRCRSGTESLEVEQTVSRGGENAYFWVLNHTLAFLVEIDSIYIFASLLRIQHFIFLDNSPRLH